MKCDIQNIQKVLLSEVLAKPHLKAEVESIAADIYSNPAALLNQEFRTNSHIYLYREDDVTCGFAMVGWSTPSVDSVADSLTVYQGLTLVSPREQGRGISQALWSAFVKYLKLWSKENCIDVNVWFFTASSVVVNSWRRLLPDLSPADDSSYSRDAEYIINRIVETSGLASYRCAKHPFIFRGVAKARYKDSESTKLTAYRASHVRNILDDQAVDEAKGDRVIIVGKLAQ